MSRKSFSSPNTRFKSSPRSNGRHLFGASTLSTIAGSGEEDENEEDESDELGFSNTTFVRSGSEEDESDNVLFRPETSTVGVDVYPPPTFSYEASDSRRSFNRPPTPLLDIANANLRRYSSGGFNVAIFQNQEKLDDKDLTRMLNSMNNNEYFGDVIATLPVSKTTETENDAKPEKPEKAGKSAGVGKATKTDAKRVQSPSKSKAKKSANSENNNPPLSAGLSDEETVSPSDGEGGGAGKRKKKKSRDSAGSESRRKSGGGGSGGRPESAPRGSGSNRPTSAAGSTRGSKSGGGGGSVAGSNKRDSASGSNKRDSTSNTPKRGSGSKRGSTGSQTPPSTPPEDSEAPEKKSVGTANVEEKETQCDPELCEAGTIATQCMGTGCVKAELIDCYPTPTQTCPQPCCVPYNIGCRTRPLRKNMGSCPGTRGFPLCSCRQCRVFSYCTELMNRKQSQQGVVGQQSQMAGMGKAVEQVASVPKAQIWFNAVDSYKEMSGDKTSCVPPCWVNQWVTTYTEDYKDYSENILYMQRNKTRFQLDGGRTTC